MAVGMRMSPIDQPLMPMELLGRRSPTPVQDIASRILGSTWCAGFTFNGITAYGDGHDSLIGGDELSDGERDALLALCRLRLDAFREQPNQRLDQIPGAHPCQGPLRVLRSPRTPTGPGGGSHHPQKTMAAPKTSATSRRSASAATLASVTAVCLRTRAHRLPRCADQLRPPRSGLCVLRAGGQRPGAAGERIRSSASPMPIQ